MVALALLFGIADVTWWNVAFGGIIVLSCDITGILSLLFGQWRREVVDSIGCDNECGWNYRHTVLDGDRENCLGDYR